MLNDTPTIPPVLFVVRLAVPFDPNVELNVIVSLFEYEAPVFEDKDTEERIVFLNGGIQTKDGKMVAQAGDVVTVYIIRKLMKLFPYLADNTTFMTIKRNETNE